MKRSSAGVKNLTGYCTHLNVQMTTTIHIPRMFLEAIEMALNGPTRRLAKDIAAALGKPEEPLLKSIQENKVCLRVFDESCDTDIEGMRCKYYVPYNEHFLVYCNEPVIWLSRPHTSRERCLHHIACKQPPILLPKITIMSGGDTKYFVDMEASLVYTEDGVNVGTYKDETITIFAVEPPR